MKDETAEWECMIFTVDGISVRNDLKTFLRTIIVEA